VEVNLSDFAFNRTRTRTYDVRNDPTDALAAIAALLCPAGTIVPTFAQVEPGPGWKLCDGQVLQKAEYPRLFAILGPTFSVSADGFALPDLRGRMPIGAGGSLPFLSLGGAASISLTVDQLPSHGHAITDPGHAHVFEGIAHGHAVTDPGHAHTITDPGHSHTSAAVASTLTAGAASGSAAAGNTGSATTGITVDSATTGVMIAETIAGGAVAAEVTGIALADTGSGAPVPILPPYIAMNWMVRT
jgi:microcystin-dependent protein